VNKRDAGTNSTDFVFAKSIFSEPPDAFVTYSTRKSVTSEIARSEPSFIVRVALFGVVGLIAKILSSHVLKRELASVFPLISVREQMATEHPTPSSLTVRAVPSARVILAANPD
jgi:hypothetical protein